MEIASSTSINSHSQSLSIPLFRASLARINVFTEVIQHIENLPPSERYNFRKVGADLISSDMKKFMDLPEEFCDDKYKKFS